MLHPYWVSLHEGQPLAWNEELDQLGVFSTVRRGDNIKHAALRHEQTCTSMGRGERRANLGELTIWGDHKDINRGVSAGGWSCSSRGVGAPSPAADDHDSAGRFIEEEIIAVGHAGCPREYRAALCVEHEDLGRLAAGEKETLVLGVVGEGKVACTARDPPHSEKYASRPIGDDDRAVVVIGLAAGAVGKQAGVAGVQIELK